MTITVGRAVINNAASNVQQQGDLLAFDITIDNRTTAGQVSSGFAIRQQLLGMLNNDDEQVFPVTSSDDPTWDGYYRVSSVNVEPFPVFLSSGAMRASFSLQRVAGGYANPVIETYVVSSVTTNSHGVTAPTYGLLASYPSAFTGVDVDVTGLDENNTTFLTVSAASEDGTVTRSLDNFYAVTTERVGYSLSYVPPADYYGPGACQIIQSSVSDFALVGKQASALTAGNWTISNGLIRISPTGNTNEINVEGWDSPAWRGRIVRAGRISAGSFTASTTFQINGGSVPVILRNSPETVVIRVSNGYSQPYFTFTLFRGATVVLVHVEGDDDVIGLGLSPTAAGTNVTGGVRTTATDANGNRFVLLRRGAVTTSTTHTAVVPSVGTRSSTYSIGWNIGATASLPYSEAAHLQQLVIPPQWQQRVSER